MNPPDDSPEITILESRGILVKDQRYDAVLTNRRIILTGYQDQKPRSIILKDLQKAEVDTGVSGDPVIILSFPSAMGEPKKVILRFSPKNFSDPHQVRLLWYSEINLNLQPAIPVSPPTTPTSPTTSTTSSAPTTQKIPVITPTRPPITQAFCVRCGTKFTDGSVFCNKCGTKIIYPSQPIPPQQTDTPVRNGVKIIEIPVEKIDLSHKKSSSPNTNDSYKKENVPFVAHKHKEHEKKKSFLPDSENENLH